jgi:DNA-binding MarR family transcriptional regulator
MSPHALTEAERTAELADRTRLAIMRLARRLRQQRADTSVTIGEISALMTLRRHGPLSARDLAERERVQPPSLTGILAGLCQAGLVDRTVHPDDRRQAVLALTAAGRELLDRETERRTRWLVGRIDELSPEARESLERACDVLEELIDA